MEARHQLDELRALQRRQRATIGRGLHSQISETDIELTDVLAVWQVANETQVRLVAADLLEPHRQELVDLELAQARSMTSDLVRRRIAHRPFKNTDAVVRRLIDRLAGGGDEISTERSNLEKVLLFMDAHALLSIADILASEAESSE